MQTATSDISIRVHPCPTSINKEDKTPFPEDVVNKATCMHISDVRRGLDAICTLLKRAGDHHDYTKCMHREEFAAYLNTFKTTGKWPSEEGNWFDKYHLEERHHLLDKPPEDINLIDVLEWLVDGVVAATARNNGGYEYRPLSDELLQKAVLNTAALIKGMTVLVSEETPATNEPEAINGFTFRT